MAILKNQRAGERRAESEAENPGIIEFQNPSRQIRRRIAAIMPSERFSLTPEAFK